MVITNLIIEFDLPFIHGLKGRRAVINSIKEKLKKFNVSILDISGEYPKEAALAVAFLSPDEEKANSYVQKIENFLYKNFPEYFFNIQYEIL